MNKQTKTKQQLRSKIRWGIAGIFALLAFAASYAAPTVVNRGIDAINNTIALGLPRFPEKGFALGLDLQGGAHLVYEADTSAIPAAEQGTAVEGVRDVIERRVTGLGVGEPSVTTARVGDIQRVIVELPGVTDVNAAIAMIGETPTLEFKEENTVPPRELTAEEQTQLDEFNADAKKRAQQIANDVRAGGDFGATATEKSEESISKNNAGYLGFLPQSQLIPEEYEWASTAREGDVTRTPIESVVGYSILKRGGEREGEAQVEASHILVCYLGAQNCAAQMTKPEALELAQQLYNDANATNFEDLAREHSTDPSAATNGGVLGSFAKGQMVPAFEEAVFSADVGQIIGPVETEFGFHIIYKTGASIGKEYELSRIFVQTQSAQDILPPQDEWMNTDLSGKQLDRAEVITDYQTGEVQVSLQFDAEGRDLFRDITSRNVRKPVAIFLDGQAISIPTVQQPITDGRAVITGNFRLQEARLLSQRLNAGALPVPVELVSQQTVGATLGAETLEKSLKAGLVGIIIVMIFMVLYYRLPGIISVVALMLYAALSLAIFKLIGVTLTLAGIAGFILSIGMAVDANVLIFERLKEELKAGKSLKGAVEEGFMRAWTSIRDGNVSTLITCVLLLFFGTSFVKGFALTLGIGVLMSLFTAITATRVMLRFVTPWFKEKGQWVFLGAKKQ